MKGIVEKKQAEYEEMCKKRDLIEEVLKRAEEEKEKQVKRDEEVQALESLVLKAETLAARENSSQNSTPEAREINNEIEQEFNSVNQLEATITQLKLDVSTFQQDIETIKKERVDKHNISVSKLSSIYKSIQQLREESSQIRTANLQTLIKNQNDEVDAEIEVQRIETFTTLYTELNNSIAAEFKAISTPETVGMVIETELSKISNILQQIPFHENESEDRMNEIKKENETILNNIAELEKKIMTSISAMAKEEDKQDELANSLKESQRKTKKLLETLRHQENVCSDIEKTIQDMKEQDATKQDKALAELDDLKSNIIALIDENEKKRETIKLLRTGQITKNSGDTPFDAMYSKIRNYTEEIERQTHEYEQEAEELKKQLSTEFSPVNSM